jgi:hypothetical protein
MLQASGDRNHFILLPHLPSRSRFSEARGPAERATKTLRQKVSRRKYQIKLCVYLSLAVLVVKNIRPK